MAGASPGMGGMDLLQGMGAPGMQDMGHPGTDRQIW